MVYYVLKKIVKYKHLKCNWVYQKPFLKLPKTAQHDEIKSVSTNTRSVQVILSC